jgi:magnesium-transporting ATPase (P-type)
MTDIFAFKEDPIWDVLLRLGVNVLVLFIVIRLIYYRYSRREGYAFSFFQMGIMIFLVCILLKTVEIQLGIALGLFAIFAITRFRSRNLSLRHMTYFFTVIGIAVINAMATFYHKARGMLLINGFIIVSLLVLEYFFHRESLNSLELTYDRLELLNPDKMADLLQDLSLRTGRQVDKVRIRSIDLKKSTAELEVYFRNSNAG